MERFSEWLDRERWGLVGNMVVCLVIHKIDKELNKIKYI